MRKRETLGRLFLLTGEENAVTRWNRIATELMVDPGPIVEGRAFAILQAAVHDAVNGGVRRYRLYTADLSSPGASLEEP
jgi:hypothetical protein